MSFAITTAVVTVASVVYSYTQTQKAKKAAERAQREAEAAADAQKGLQFVTEGEAVPLNVLYGKNKIGGVRVHSVVRGNYLFADPSPNTTVFEAGTISATTPTVWRLTNSNPSDWSGTWTYTVSSVDQFNSELGYVATKGELDIWKYPDREGTTYKAPKVDFVYIPFSNSGTSFPTIPFSQTGLEFHTSTVTSYSLDHSVTGTKNEFLFIQQAIAYGNIHRFAMVDIDNKEINYGPFSYGLRIHAYRKGSEADSLMAVNDSSRNYSRFSYTAYATCVFRLNRDDPQYSGSIPNVQFYAEGAEVYSVVKSGGTYSLSPSRSYSNNSALVILDYLINTNYGKGLGLSQINLESFYNAAKICDILVYPNKILSGKVNTDSGVNNGIRLYTTNMAISMQEPIRENLKKLLSPMFNGYLLWSEGKYKLNLRYAVPYKTGTIYTQDSVVQIRDTSGDTPRNRLFRALNNTNTNPLVSTANWTEDQTIDVTDDDLLIDSALEVSWPDFNSKYNFVTVRFLNEEKDFSEDTVSWPDKEPADGSTVYQTMLAEDNGVPLEFEVYETGITDIYHAKARAEQLVRASRATVTISFRASTSLFYLEPGDIINFSSLMYNIPPTLMLVNSIDTQEGSVVNIVASTFDANMYAWNVADNYYVKPQDPYSGYSLKQAYNLNISQGLSNTATSDYILTWNKANDNRVVRYVIKYTDDSINDVTSTTLWEDLGTVSGTRFELPPLDGNYTFTVVSMDRNGRQAPFLNFEEGSTWPLINKTLSNSFLKTNDYNLIITLTNASHNFFGITTPNTQSTSLAGSGTEIRVYYNGLSLIYDDYSDALAETYPRTAGNIPGTFTVIPQLKTNVTSLDVAKDIYDGTVCKYSRLTGIDSSTGSIEFIIRGTLLDGSSFNKTVTQVFEVRPALSNTAVKYASIISSAPVVYRNSQGFAFDGSYENITVTGKTNTQSSDWGYVTIRKNTDLSESPRYSSITTNFTETDKFNSLIVNLYETSTSTEILDSYIIPVIYRDVQELGALNVILSKPSIMIPVLADGTATTSSYDDSGTSMYLYMGGARLSYNPNRTLSEKGTWSIDTTNTSQSNITLSTDIQDAGEYAIIGNHSNMTANTAAIIYKLKGTTPLGTNFDIDTTQTFVKIKSGQSSIQVGITPSTFVFVTDSSGTITSYNGSATTIEVYEGTQKLTFAGEYTGQTPTELGKYFVVASGNGIRPGGWTSTDTNGSPTNVNGNATYANASSMTATSASINYRIVGKALDGSLIDTTRVQQFVLQMQGIPGSKTSNVNLYQWSTTFPPVPTGSSLFNWTTLKNGTYYPSPTSPNAVTDYWKSEIPVNPGVPGLSLYVASRTIESSAYNNETVVDWTNSVNIIAATSNGLDGLVSATAKVFLWSVTVPILPSGSCTLNWSDGTYTVPDSVVTAGWTRTPLDPVSNNLAGFTLYELVLEFRDSIRASTSTKAWNTGRINPISYAGTNGVDGADGEPGQDGLSGNSYVNAYAVIPVSYEFAGAANAYIDTTTYSPPSTLQSSSVWNTPVTTTWKIGEVPKLTNNSRLWMCDGVYTPGAGIRWSPPYWASFKVGSLSAITANLGTVTAGYMQNPAGNFIIDLNNGYISISV